MSGDSKTESLISKLEKERSDTAKSILEFDFKKKRVRILSNVENVKSSSNGILYWMSREFRVQDNWNMLFAQKLALKNKIPLHVVFFLLPKFLDASVRHYKFLINGLKEVQEECKKLNITFHLYPGWPYEHLPKIVKDNNIGAVICDFFPLRLPMKWQDEVKEELPEDVPFIQVDGHNIVPCWIASDKQEYAARTIRNKITSKLDTYLTQFPPVIKHPHTGKIEIADFDWDEALKKCDIEQSMPDVTWAKPGYKAGIQMLESFINKRLKNFASKRNDPCADALSKLSPWLHFGQISAQRCILEVKRFSKNYLESVNAYCEEAIVRRELGDNFCFYNSNYDNIEGAANWAQTTLNEHRKDKRTYLYTRDELAMSKTHDALWNSAQIELVKEGKMHGFMRMYWAKKILEWTETPEQAIEFGIYLNDHYSLDGRDPNGYTGVMWSVCGVHDQGWAERNIFGKIRYMNYEGCKRKFNIDAYISRWGGKEYKHKANGAEVKVIKKDSKVNKDDLDEKESKSTKEDKKSKDTKQKSGGDKEKDKSKRTKKDEHKDESPKKKSKK